MQEENKVFYVFLKAQGKNAERQKKPPVQETEAIFNCSDSVFSEFPEDVLPDRGTAFLSPDTAG
jgi:hypothetical protein